MADQILPCSCTPNSNICCCGPQSGISVVQPTCQTLPDGSVVNNPAYAPMLTTSYWTYKFITDCDQDTRSISGIGIPVCETIQQTTVTVFEKVDGCGDYVSVPFTLIENDPNFGTAPAGFQWLKIENSGRYDAGVCVEYRIQLTGDFPTDVQPIKVKAATNVLTFDCGCFLVPKCNPQGKLAVTKTCMHTIANNQVTYTAQVNVTNIGNAPLTNVQFNDTIFISPLLGIGTIAVNPPTLNVNTSTPGQIIISGNLGTINPGQTVVVNYTIFITSIPSPRKYITNNTATATATSTQDFAQCSSNLDVVQVSVAKCCNILDSSTGTFTITVSSVGDSPNTTVNIRDHFSVPAGVTIHFTSFDGCSAVFTSSGLPVPLNTDIVGPVDITAICDNVFVPAGGAVSAIGIFIVTASSAFGTATISNAVTSVVLSNPSSAVFLGAGQLPVTADIDVTLKAGCRQPCA